MIHGSPAEMSGCLLHVGCGGDALPDWLSGYRETRLDIDPRHAPDIVASMTDMGDVGEYDAVLCRHALEHVYPHEVPVVLNEFLRVLRPGGCALIFVPDLQGVEPTDEVLFISVAGPITGLDLIYGKADMIERMPFMAHHCGFTRDTLHAALTKAGFGRIVVDRLGCNNLFAAAIK